MATTTYLLRQEDTSPLPPTHAHRERSEFRFVRTPGEVYSGNFRRMSPVKGSPALLQAHRAHSSRVSAAADPPVWWTSAICMYRRRASTMSPRDEVPEKPKLYILYYYNLTDIRVVVSL